MQPENIPFTTNVCVAHAHLPQRMNFDFGTILQGNVRIYTANHRHVLIIYILGVPCKYGDT